MEINVILKKIIGGLIFAVLLCSCRNLADDDTYSSEYKNAELEARDDDVITTETLTKKVVDVYYVKNKEKKIESDPLILYFDQNSELPYVEVKSFLNTFWNNSTKKNIKIKKEGKKYKISKAWNENYYVTIDFSTGEVAYSDYDYFCASENAAASCDIIYDKTVLERKKIMDIQAAKAYSRNLNDYGIPYKYECGHGFIPLEVAQLITNSGNHIAYNGEAAFEETDSAYETSDYSKEFAKPFIDENTKKPIKETLSEDFAKYSYNFLCLAMDMKYGRKAYKNITSFDNWITASGLKDALTSTNVLESEKALGTMLLTNIGDLHTYYQHLTPYLGLIDDEYGDKILIGTKDAAKNLNIENIINSSGTRYTNNAAMLKALMSAQPKFMYCDTSNTGYDTSDKDENKKVKDKIMNIFIPRDLTTANPSVKTNTIFLTFSNFESSGNYAVNYKEKWAYTKIGGKTKTDGVHFYISTDGADLTEITTDGYKIDNFIADINNSANYTNGYGISFDNESDTILITVVSNYIIKQLNEGTGRKIENVVLDLSRNGGGSCDDEVFIASWFLGQVDVHTKNTITGSSSSVSFVADVDFDGKYNDLYQYTYYERTGKTKDDTGAVKINDPEDTICNLKRYCITSLQSFSCGNLLPVHIAAKDTVTLIGQTSGGGTCAVAAIEMPSGTRFSTSSPWQFSTLVNGAPVDIDAGTTPDTSVSPSDFATIYNRETFCETYIK